ncbi:hypothetical protein RN001_009014 [Aquatica leii]|uniref:Mitochondrial cardiolipin hydrolase n=1 Tax=Aquatica leii TaxID=1421715 RepID=A0AAN7SMP0_9COLE|nr:hypothetical protein RN001_009014 [Aquatica leii]
MAENPASKIMHLKEQGLKLKVQPSGRDNLLHHKFCLIDENHPKDSKIFFGTLNLTLQGMTSNFDAIIFTNNVQIVQKYRDEFEFLWSSFKSV